MNIKKDPSGKERSYTKEYTGQNRYAQAVRLNDTQSIREFGADACRPLILNALKVSTAEFKEAERWVHIGEAVIEKLQREPKLFRAAALGLLAQASVRRGAARREVKRLLRLH